jgi:hypothetical protein
VKTLTEKSSYRQLISVGALVALFGFIMSGPISYALVQFLKPQPAWSSAQVFAQNYGPIQNIPYYFGFFLISGMFMVSVGHYLNYMADNSVVRFRLMLSVGSTTIFCVLISFNYISQISFVHNLVSDYMPEYDAAISIFSMSNPRSLCWAIEMWGYGILGVSTWLMAKYYEGGSSWIRLMLQLNGGVSLVSAVWISIGVEWVMSPVGLISYIGWNVLMIVLMIAIYRDSSKLSKAHI